MAKEKAQDIETPLPPPKAKSKLSVKKVLIMGFLGLLLTGGGLVAYVLMTDEPPVGKEAQAGQGSLHNRVTMPLDPFLVNLADKESRRYLKLKVELEVNSEGTKDELQQFLPHIRDSLILLLSSKTYLDISSFEGKQQLKKEIKQRVAAIPGGKKVSNVLFTEFVAQQETHMSKVLSQEEVDALLKGLVEGDIEVKPDQAALEAGVVPYDFTSQERIIRGRMPTMEVINEHFARAFRISLSMILRRTVDIQTNFVQMLKFGEFLKSLPLPSSFNIYKMDPLRGQGLMVVDSKLVFALVECFLGGSAKTRFKIEGRDFTSIERRIIQKVVLMAFQDLEKAWAPVHSVRMNLIRVEINPMFVGIATPNDIMVISRFQVEMEQAEGFIFLCMPYATVEPIKGKLYSGFQSEQLEQDNRWTSTIQEQVQDMEVEVLVELASTQMRAKDLLNLTAGDVIMFNKKVNDPLLGKVEGVPKFTGHAGQIYNAKGFKIQKMLYPSS